MKAWAFVYGPEFGKGWEGKIARYQVFSTRDNARAERPDDYRVARVIVQVITRKK